MLVGGLRQSTLFKLSVFGSCGFLTFCPTGRRRGLGEHMFNSTCPLFHPLLLSILSSIPKTSVWLIFFFSLIFLFPPFFYALLSSLSFVLHFPFALSMSILPPVVHPAAPPPSRPPRESNERAWGSSKCGSTSWREMQYRPRRPRAISLNSTRFVCMCASGCVCSINWAHWAQTLLLLA